MADISGEDAFLASLGGEEYSTQDVQPHSSEEEEEEEDDYDPSSFLPSKDDPSQATESQPTHKPATIGGFIAEDSDEDDDDDDEGATSNNAGAVDVASIKSPSQALAGSVSQTSLSTNAQMYNTASEPPASHPVANGGDAERHPSVLSATTPAPAFDGATTNDSVGQAVSLEANGPASRPTSTIQAALPKARLPQDVVGQFEDRISDDPKGDVDAWLGLIAFYKSKSKYDEVRKVYARFFEVFPMAADQWVNYAHMELELDEVAKLEGIFGQAVVKLSSIPLWCIYLDHVRRRNDIMTDTSGQGRQTVSQAYEFVLNYVGHDKDSGKVWQDYISFIKAGPGNAGGTGWQDAQKMDLLRKAYQRAICVPMEAVSTLWKEYDQFEMGLNKVSGRKYLQEKSPSYMTARSSYTALQNITAGLRRGGIPVLPPMPGCAGDEAFATETETWQRWIEWEKEDPLVLKDEDLKAFQQRVIYVYKQATMSLRFYAQIWYDAAEWCFNNGLENDGNDFLSQGTEAVPESCLLAFKRADRLEQTMQVEDGDDGLKRKGDAVKKHYDNVLNALYGIIDKVKAREPLSIARIEEEFAATEPEPREASPEAAEEEDDAVADMSKPLSRRAMKEKRIEMIQEGTKTHIKLISRTLTYVWIALMRAFRRIQGKGKPGDKLIGMRGIFTEARKRGRLLSDMYAASALMEHHCYKDPAALRIFERGIKLFPDDENFTLEYIKHLISTDDVTNARSVFEITVAKITSKPAGIPRAKLLYSFFHAWEAQYGELNQLTKIEKRMAELYPEDPALNRFARRFASSTTDSPTFDPCAVRIIISPTQMRPKPLLAEVPVPTIETIAPTPALVGYTQSPKRPLEDSDAEQPARKLLRGESPLKGAAGRRQQQRQAREGLATATVAAPAAAKGLPPSIHAILAMIPPARQWVGTRFDPQRMTDLLRSIDLSQATSRGGAPGYGYGYGR